MSFQGFASRKKIRLQAELLEDRTVPALLIDGTKRFQVMDGFGVNANVNSWDEAALRPAINLLADDLGSSLWRVYIDNTDWEATNDNADPLTFNWNYYNALYSTPRFEKAWALMSELNAHGITNGLVLNFMGQGPSWMGGSTLLASQEDEWVEMVLSYAYYARFNRGIIFHKIAPFNESDWNGKEGILANPTTMVQVLEKLAQRLDQLGMSDVRFVQPDTAFANNATQNYIPALLASPIVMAKLNDFGLHIYDGGKAGLGNIIANSNYPDRGYWVDEQSFGNDTSFDPVDNLMNHLEDGATATLVFKAYDGQDNHHPPGEDYPLGLLQYDSTSQTYTPRKGYYVIKQVHKFIQPGATRIAADQTYSGLRTYAFSDPATGRLTILGRNTSSSPISVSGSLANLLAGRSFQFYYTDGTVNFTRNADVPITANQFAFVAPANSVFTLTSVGPADTIAPMIAFASPADGATVSGNVTLSATAADDLGVAGVQFRLDGVNIGGEITTAPYSLAWNSFAVPNGAHRLTAIVRDLAGNVTVSTPLTITVNNQPDITPPQVTLTSPTAGGTVAGNVAVSADASDNVGVVGVQFLVNGSPIGAEDTVAPYSVDWNTVSLPNATYTLTAKARDVAGNITTSSAITVTVHNVGPSGLVGAWGFEEGSGNIAGDVSGNSLNGTISGAAWTTNGKFGKALVFNGTNNWVTIAGNSLLGLTTGMTLEAWVQPTSLTGWTTVLLKERSNSGLAYSLYASADDSNPPAGYINESGTDYAAKGSSTLPLNTWTHLAVTFDGATLVLYVNGIAIGSLSVGGTISTTSDALRIGGNSVWGEYFAGLIDEVRVYNRALTATEIQTDMNTPVGGGGGGLAVSAPAGSPPVMTADHMGTMFAPPVDISTTTPPRVGESTPGVLAPIIAEAIHRWVELGVTPSQLETLQSVKIVIADLAGSQLGFSSRGTIWIDRDAAGYGWFIDTTPGDDSEFEQPGDQGEQGRVDLLTLLIHEMGHALGLGHTSSTADVMHESLPTGERRLSHDDEVTRAPISQSSSDLVTTDMANPPVVVDREPQLSGPTNEAGTASQETVLQQSKRQRIHFVRAEPPLLSNHAADLFHGTSVIQAESRSLVPEGPGHAIPAAHSAEDGKSKSSNDRLDLIRAFVACMLEAERQPLKQKDGSVNIRTSTS